MKQISFATLAEAGKKRQTKRERFLAEMEAVVPWAALVTLIEPHCPKAGKGRWPRGLEAMLRIYFMQQWFKAKPAPVDAYCWSSVQGHDPGIHRGWWQATYVVDECRR